MFVQAEKLLSLFLADQVPAISMLEKNGGSSCSVMSQARACDVRGMEVIGVREYEIVHKYCSAI